MAPHRNHVEARSNRKPARQYVSETHDHKPDAPAAKGGPTEADPTRPYCKPDQSCCDFVCGN